MWRIIGSIIKNQASGGKWLILEDIVNTVMVYVYCYGDKVELEHMVEYQDGSG